MEYIIGILILVSFFGLAFYAAKGGNLMMGMLVMAILWTVLPMIGNTFPTNPAFVAANAENVGITWIQAFSKVFQSGPGRLGDRSGQRRIRRLVWTRALRDGNCLHADPKDHGAGR